MATYSEYKTLVKERVQVYVAQNLSKDHSIFESKAEVVQLTIYLYYITEKSDLGRYARDLSEDEYYQGEIMIGISDLYGALFQDFYIHFEAKQREDEERFFEIKRESKPIEHDFFEVTCNYLPKIQNKKIKIQCTKNNEGGLLVRRSLLEKGFEEVLSVAEKVVFTKACEEAYIDRHSFSLIRTHPFASSWIVMVYQQAESLTVFKKSSQTHIQPIRCKYRSVLFSPDDSIQIWTPRQPRIPLFSFRIIRHA